MRHPSVTRALRFACALALVAVVLAAVAGAASAKKTSYAQTIRHGRKLAQQYFTQSGATSMTLALVSRNKVVWQQTYGYADVASQTAPGPDTMFGIGSVSKVICASAIMRLVDQGKVELDAPFVRYVPQFRMMTPFASDITVRMLIDHSSGLPGTTYRDWVTSVYYPWYHQMILDTLTTEFLKWTPGEASVYCNDGFTLAEMVVQAVSGKTYAQFVQDEVFAPLGMTHSTFPMAPFAAGSYAQGYDGSKVLPREVVQLLGSGGAYSTPSDMARLARMFMNGGTLDGVRFLSKNAIAEMTTNQVLRTYNPAPSTMINYGLGWDTVTEPALGRAGITGWAKNGGSSQYGASLVVAPKAKLAMMAIGTPVVTAYLDALTRDTLLHAAKEQGTISKLPSKAATTAPKPKKASQTEVGRWVGYWANYNSILRISRDPANSQVLVADSLDAGGWQPASTSFRLRKDGLFHSDGGANGYRLVTGGNRLYSYRTFAGLDGYSKSGLLWAQKVEPRAELSAAWKARLGTTWLEINEAPTSLVFLGAKPTLTVRDVPGLPGYVFVSVNGEGGQVVDASENDDSARMFLQLPGNEGRDLEDLDVVAAAPDDLMMWGGSLFRPLATVPALASGANTVTINGDGDAEWVEAASAAALHISGQTYWYLYDSSFGQLAGGQGDPTDVNAPAHSYLIVFAAPGASISVTAAP